MDRRSETEGDRGQVVDPIVEDDATLVHLNDPIDQRCDLIQPVAGDDHRRIVALGEKFQEGAACGWVEIGCSLIQDQ